MRRVADPHTLHKVLVRNKVVVNYVKPSEGTSIPKNSLCDRGVGVCMPVHSFLGKRGLSVCLSGSA